MLTSVLVAQAIIFALTYAAIALEHPLRVSKSASALIGAGLLWTGYALAVGDAAAVGLQLGESLSATAQIVFFLMGAMAIVEVVAAHDGFAVITARITTTRLPSLMWQVGLVSFFLSAILDNLTTTLVMIALLRKLLARHEDRLLFAGIVVISANAGGAWSPIGDVTTTMLWIGGQVTTGAIVTRLLLPSLVCMAVPLAIVAYRLRGRTVEAPPPAAGLAEGLVSAGERKLMFGLGLAILLAVPVFKTVTHLPPFMGILLGLGLLWLLGDCLHRKRSEEAKEALSLGYALSRIDLAALLFFVGILLAVATLEHSHLLTALAQALQRWVGRQDVIVLGIGLASAVVDNVPLVAAAMGMYSLAQYPPDHFMWEFMAYCAGTGGSILIVGSAAGVAAMGLEKIRFFWYLRHVGGLALLGYFAGAAVYLLQYRLLH